MQLACQLVRRCTSPFDLPLFHFHLTSDYLMRSDYILYIQCINRLLPVTVVVATVGPF